VTISATAIILLLLCLLLFSLRFLIHSWQGTSIATSPETSAAEICSDMMQQADAAQHH
jgi:hypothetical protein